MNIKSFIVVLFFGLGINNFNFISDSNLNIFSTKINLFYRSYYKEIINKFFFYKNLKNSQLSIKFQNIYSEEENQIFSNTEIGGKKLDFYDYINNNKQKINEYQEQYEKFYKNNLHISKPPTGIGTVFTLGIKSKSIFNYITYEEWMKEEIKQRGKIAQDLLFVHKKEYKSSSIYRDIVSAFL